MSKRRYIIGGNWKMHKTPSEAADSVAALKKLLGEIQTVEVVVCPPAVDLGAVAAILKGTNLGIGGQNMHWEDEGAFTGETSARMLRAAHCEYVIVGHSERRHVFAESDSDTNKKLHKAVESGLKPIFCIGETLEERKMGLTRAVVERQVRAGLMGVEIHEAEKFVIAYEPVWAIGTGVNATPEQAEEVHGFVRELLGQMYSKETAEQIRIQYGGSVKSSNATELLTQKNIDGALVGGASLDAGQFSDIVRAAYNLTQI